MSVDPRGISFRTVFDHSRSNEANHIGDPMLRKACINQKNKMAQWIGKRPSNVSNKMIQNMMTRTISIINPPTNLQGVHGPFQNPLIPSELGTVAPSTSKYSRSEANMGEEPQSKNLVSGKASPG